MLFAVVWKECQCSCYSQDVAMTMREGQRCWGQDIKTYWDVNVWERQRERQSGWWSCLILDFYLDPLNAHNISRLNHSGIRVCEQIRCFFFIHSCLQMLLDFCPGCNINFSLFNTFPSLTQNAFVRWHLFWNLFHWVIVTWEYCGREGEQVIGSD